MSGAKLLPTIVTAYLVYCVCFCHLKIQHSAACVLIEGITDLQLYTHPPPPLTPSPSHLCTFLYTCATHDITVSMKNLLKIQYYSLCTVDTVAEIFIQYKHYVDK